MFPFCNTSMLLDTHSAGGFISAHGGELYQMPLRVKVMLHFCIAMHMQVHEGQCHYDHFRFTASRIAKFDNTVSCSQCLCTKYAKPCPDREVLLPRQRVLNNSTASQLIEYKPLAGYYTKYKDCSSLPHPSALLPSIVMD